MKNYLTYDSTGALIIVIDHVDIGKYSDNELTQYFKINKRIKFLTKQVI